MALQEAAVQGIELENWAKMIPDLVYSGDTLYSRIKKAAKSYPSANVTNAGGVSRPAFRVGMRVQSGSGIQQSNADGGSLGRGTGSQWISGDISPVFLTNGCEITYLSEVATSGPKRGMVSVRAQELKNSLTAFMNGIEALAQGDSSGAITSIPATAVVSSNSGSGATTSFIQGLENANQLQDQQVVQVFPAEGGTSRGLATVSYVDGSTNTVWFSTVLPSTGGATAVGDVIVINGATGAVGNSIAGIKTYQVNGNSGSVLNLLRANYPSRLSTPLIDLGGKAINPTVPYRAEILIKRGLGKDSDCYKEMVWYGGPDQRLAVTNLYQGVLSQNDIYAGGKSAGDVVKGEMILRFGDKEYVESYNATPGRIDGLCLSNWGVVETVEPSLYSFGNGVTTMPVPDPDGAGYLASNIFYHNGLLNFFNSNMKAGVIIQNAAPVLI